MKRGRPKQAWYIKDKDWPKPFPYDPEYERPDLTIRYESVNDKLRVSYWFRKLKEKL